jgi:hypothetical protein
MMRLPQNWSKLRYVLEELLHSIIEELHYDVGIHNIAKYCMKSISTEVHLSSHQ